MLRVTICCLLAIASCIAPAAEPTLPNTETTKGELLAPQEALAKIKLPPGFQVSLFAHEPAVQNPIAMAFDARNRLWIAENYTYAERSKRFDLSLKDRIIILEDTNVDGRAEKRTVFSDQLQMLTSIAVAPEGVYALCPPQLLFIPNANHDDQPDGPAQLLLDGFTVPQDNYHNYANGLKWGPDGWLYGRCGASSPGELGLPGCKPEDRIPMRGTMWRYHCTRKVVEVLTHGTTNPWGHDWNELGELFFINTVNGHLWHAMPGSHYVRPHTIDPHPHAYEFIDQHADHWHFDTGKGWTASRDGAANDFGGGHAHSGMLIYQGQQFPPEYQGKLLTLNLHGRRANMERLERKGSGYVGKHEPDAFFFNDPWFRGIDLGTGLDGAVYALDWSDTGECHENTGVHRTSGRVYKISYPNQVPLPPWNEFSSPNMERFRQAQLNVRALALAGSDLVAEAANSRRLLSDSHQKTAYRLRALWLLNIGNKLTEAELMNLLRDRDEAIRAWAIRLLTDNCPLDTCTGQRPNRPEGKLDPAALAAFQQMGRYDDSALVRGVLASTLQRLPHADRITLAVALVSNAGDANDHNLPLLVWYGIAPLGEKHAEGLVRIAAYCTWPTTRRLIARRLAEQIESQPAVVQQLLLIHTNTMEIKFDLMEIKLDILQGLSQGLAGWHKTQAPPGWDEFQKSLADEPKAQDKLRDLNVLFGSGRALDEVKRLALDGKTEMAIRKSALQSLVKSRTPEARAICEQLLGTRFLNTVALQGLATEDDPAIGEKLVKAYKSFAQNERPLAIGVLVTRAAWAKSLLQAISEKKIERDDLSAFQVRSMLSLNNAELNMELERVWGQLRESTAEKKQQMEKLKAELTPAALAKANASQGRAIFAKSCATCHTLFGEGGKRGPDLTGAQRQNLDYLLENIIDPSATVSADFKLKQLAMHDGRVLMGIVSARTDKTLTLLTPLETLTINKADVDEETPSALSLMPDNLLQTLSPEQVRDLFAYLTSVQQVELLKE